MASWRTAARAVGVALWAVGCAAVVLELGLRLTVSWTPGYYTVARQSGGAEQRFEYAFGDITVNSQGIADDLPRGDRPVVAWIGDSVLYGIGCGQGARVTELLEARHPADEHLNLGVAGFAALDTEWRKALAQAQRYHARSAVWLFNLNDVIPDANHPLPGPRPWTLPKPPLLQASYLWTAFDASFASWQIRKHGVVLTEAWPGRRAVAFADTANRIRKIRAEFLAVGIPMTVMVLPLEMQVSAPAAAFYQRQGVVWEDGFLDGSPQAALAAAGPLIDLRPAFLAHQRREDIPLGRYYVATEGGRLDWNHLNRDGHAAVAAWLTETGWAP